MASSQITLARHRTPVPAPRTSRQAVPAFLQKLHEMVNDPNNGDLIRWSEAGDSFYVLDHERFAREVLGRWFKHQNFASFVRQLNMYGFHKIPHLQQGVLRSDTDTEFWNFAHPNFHRGQPDLLCLIQRKKQTAQPGDEPVMEFRETAPVQAQTSPSGQVIDIHAIVNGIATIKHHQSTISSELNKLKRSNQLLWQDAMDARAKHQKQQDTINRIVKFLAGVFGHHATQHKDDGVESVQTRAVIPRRKSRFLIEDGRSAKVTVEDEQDGIEDDINDATLRYPIIDTPQSAPSPASEAVSPSPLIRDYSPNLTELPKSPQPPKPPPPSSTTVNQAYSQQGPLSDSTPHQQPNLTERSVTPNRSHMNMEFDPRIQVVLNQLTPGQIQHLLSSLSHTLDSTPASDSSSSQLTQYTPPFDLYNQSVNSPSPPIPRNSAPPPTEGLLPFDDNHDAISLQDPHLNNISQSWKVAEDVERDVNAMTGDLDSFIRDLGLDPRNLAVSSPNSVPGTPPPHTIRPENTHVDSEVPPAPAPPPTDPLFDFDTFLNTLSGGSAGGHDTSFSSDGGEPFLEIDHAGAPITIDTASSLHHHQPQGAPPDAQTTTSPSATKRKSDVSDVHALAHAQTSTQSVMETTNNTSPPAAVVKPSKRRRNK